MTPACYALCCLALHAILLAFEIHTLSYSKGEHVASSVPAPGMEVRRLLSAMRRCSLRREPTSADRLDSLLPDTRSSLRFVSAPMPACQPNSAPVR